MAKRKKPAGKAAEKADRVPSRPPLPKPPRSAIAAFTPEAIEAQKRLDDERDAGLRAECEQADRSLAARLERDATRDLTTDEVLIAQTACSMVAALTPGWQSLNTTKLSMRAQQALSRLEMSGYVERLTFYRDMTLAQGSPGYTVATVGRLTSHFSHTRCVFVPTIGLRLTTEGEIAKSWLLSTSPVEFVRGLMTIHGDRALQRRNVGQEEIPVGEAWNPSPTAEIASLEFNDDDEPCLSFSVADTPPAVVAQIKLHDPIEGQLPPNCAHSNDFTSLRWHGRLFTFSPQQARVVNILVEHYRRGTPAVGVAYLLEACDAAGGRIRDVFKEHDAWKTAIVTVGRNAVSLCSVASW